MYSAILHTFYIWKSLFSSASLSTENQITNGKTLFWTMAIFINYISASLVQHPCCTLRMGSTTTRKMLKQVTGTMFLQPRSQGPLSSYLEKVPWLRLVTCLCIQITSTPGVGL